MSSSEIKYTLCNCCLELACSKNLWTEYSYMGQSEVYGEMLKDCFNLVLMKQEDAENAQICEVCLTRLRNAWTFKRQVIESQSVLAVRLKENREHDIADTKVEISISNEVEHGHFSSEDETDGGDNTVLEIVVRDKKRTRKEHMKKMKTTQHKGRRELKQTILTEKFTSSRGNVQQILQYSTICPFKSLHGYFSCFYCNKQYVLFEELRVHVNENHGDMNKNSILKSIYRPHDKVKADISDITCKICAGKFNSVQDIVDHLTDRHDLHFNKTGVDPADSIIGYDLSDGRNRCCVCKSEFTFFKNLTKHMNEHGVNFICDTCGRSFLSKQRLNVHQRFHDGGVNVKCEFCDKICASKFLLNSHKNHAHSNRAFVCRVCNETFKNYRTRLKHLEEVHGRTKINLECKICTKIYTSLSSLTEHMRTVHQRIRKEAKLSCNECDKVFTTKNKLREHEVVHTGVKNHECEICHKKFMRNKSLKEHLKIHRNDKRWSCAACGHAFVQKCSLKNHIGVHHAGVDKEQLIVYQKPNKSF